MTNTREVVSKTFKILRGDATPHLQECLAQLSKSSVGSTANRFRLVLNSVHITPPILALLVQVLNQPLPKAPTNIDPKWYEVWFRSCSFASEENVEGYCTPDERRLLGEALARRTSSLTFVRSCQEILACLFTAPNLGIERFGLDYMKLSTLECEGLGGLIQRCHPLKRLYLDSVDLEKPQMLLEPIRNAIHLQKFRIRGDSWQDVRWYHTARDMVLRLLQNSQNQLQELTLRSISLNDCEFMAIAEALPTSRLAFLNILSNNVGAQGILAFANQLPRIKFLKEVVLGGNPWENSFPFF